MIQLNLNQSFGLPFIVDGLTVSDGIHYIHIIVFSKYSIEHFWDDAMSAQVSFSVNVRG